MDAINKALSPEELTKARTRMEKLFEMSPLEAQATALAERDRRVKERADRAEEERERARHAKRVFVSGRD